MTTIDLLTSLGYHNNMTSNLELIKQHQQGNRTATNTLLKAHMGLIYKISATYLHVPGYNKDDLIQEGLIGLTKCLDKFDTSKVNIKFSPYASFWIKSCMRKFLLTNNSMVRSGTREGNLFKQQRDHGLTKTANRQDKGGEFTIENEWMADNSYNPECLLINGNKDRQFALISNIAKSKYPSGRKLDVLNAIMGQTSNASVGRKYNVSREAIRVESNNMIKEIKDTIKRNGL